VLLQINVFPIPLKMLMLLNVLNSVPLFQRLITNINA